MTGPESAYPTGDRPSGDRLPGDRLALIYQLSQTFNSSLDLDEVLDWVMDEVIELMRAERGFIMLTGAEGDLVFKTARGMDHQTIEAPQFQVSRGIVERVAELGEPVLTSDAQLDDRFSGRQSVVSLGLRSILCAPLTHKGRVSGVVYVDNRLQAGIFSADDLELLHAIASNAATAIENARLYQIAIEKGRMERELQMARQVQVGLLPAHLPEVPGWAFAAAWRPALEVSGDFYDFIRFDSDQLGMVIGDVTDKGMPASLFMVFTRSAVRASLDQSVSPATGIARANRLVCLESHQGLFTTLFYGHLDFGTGLLTYVNAGHNPPLLYQSGTDSLVTLNRTGIPLGVDDDVVFDQYEVTISPGDFLLAYTDGVTEAHDPSHREYGLERLKEMILSHKGESPEQILAALQESLLDYIQAVQPQDDTTIVLIQRLP